MSAETHAKNRARILALADAGLKAADIADEIGCHQHTVYRIARGRLKAKAPVNVADYARLKRIVRANEVAERGTRDELAARFGLASRHSFNAMVCYARKMLAAEARA